MTHEILLFLVIKSRKKTNCYYVGFIGLPYDWKNIRVIRNVSRKEGFYFSNHKTNI